VLALDTTTRAGSVAVCDDERVLAVIPGDGSRTHAERLPGELAMALAAAAMTREQIDLLAVATGPGAFTGLRIGLATIQGLAMTLNKPVVGVSALDALAEQVRNSDSATATPAAHSAPDVIVPWMDAQRGEVFATLIDRSSGLVLEAPTAATPDVLLNAWRAHLSGRRVVFIGDAAARDAAVIARHADGSWETRVPSPLAPHIAVLGLRRARSGEGGPPHTLEPIYVRRPDPEIERDRERLAGRSERGQGGPP
jgi:tRNA threonylcarbamoyladenosine biosynthesis protein TsaB